MTSKPLRVVDAGWDEIGNPVYTLEGTKTVNFDTWELIDQALSIKQEAGLTPRQISDELAKVAAVNFALTEINEAQKKLLADFQNDNKELLEALRDASRLTRDTHPSWSAEWSALIAKAQQEGL